MPPQRANAAHIAPYLTHIVSHHGQLTLVPPDNNGRRRKAKQPREEPVRFSSGPTAETSSSRGSRRSSRPLRTNDYDIPDYPPPSFQEAISSPPVSVCPSTTTLGQYTTAGTAGETDNSDSGSESDDASLNIPDPGRSSPSPLRASPIPRGREVLDSDPNQQPRTVRPRPSRRHLSLSPLRTLFPPRSARESSPGAPSPQSLTFSRSSPFFRSTTSLRTLPSSTLAAPPSPSVQSENSVGPRRFFSNRGKERASGEALDSWEIVETMLPEDSALQAALPHTDPNVSVAQEPPVVDISPRPSDSGTPSLHPLSERDRRTKTKNWVPSVITSAAQERQRPAPPHPPPRPPPAVSPPIPSSPGAPPPIVTVRTKKPPPPPPPKRKPAPVPSPLRATASPIALPDLDLDRAVRTPLPSTPVAGSPTSFSAFPEEPRAEVNGSAEAPLLTSQPSSGTSEDTANPSAPQPGHHYPGRPLPRWPRLIVDSTYAPHPDFPQTPLPPVPTVPEALLIDLDEVAPPPSQPVMQPLPSAAISADLNQLRPPTPTDMHRTSSASSVDLAPSSSSEFMEVTDLDVLIARLENDQHDGANYDALLLVSQFIGPATRAAGPRPPPSQARQTSSIKTSALLTGHIEVLRRRTTKDGRVKLKLALLGVAVDRCGICMTQFKQAQHARLSDACKHAFHARCLGRWVVRSRTCPLCRVVLNLEAGRE